MNEQYYHQIPKLVGDMDSNHRNLNPSMFQVVFCMQTKSVQSEYSIPIQTYSNTT